MADGEEQDLERRQPGLSPIARALRETYDAENHDSLGNDLTGLMLQLARVDDDALLLPAQPLAAPPHPVAPRGWFARLFWR